MIRWLFLLLFFLFWTMVCWRAGGKIENAIYWRQRWLRRQLEPELRASWDSHRSQPNLKLFHQVARRHEANKNEKWTKFVGKELVTFLQTTLFLKAVNGSQTCMFFYQFIITQWPDENFFIRKFFFYQNENILGSFFQIPKSKADTALKGACFC